MLNNGVCNIETLQMLNKQIKFKNSYKFSALCFTQSRNP